MRRLALATLLATLTVGLVAPPAQALAETGAPARAAKGPKLTVDLKQGKHRISPLVYGVNSADAAFAKKVRLPVNRWGGNAAETYNWQLKGSNRGKDYYFENFPDCWIELFGYCAQNRDFSAVDAQVQQDRSTKTTSLIALPMMGWVAKNVAYGNPHPCAYPSSTFDPQDAHDPFNPGCGNGQRGGQWIDGADPGTAGTAVGPSFSAAWIAALKQKYGAARSGGVALYELGNEPSLWDDTHHAFHPQPTTYDELWTKSRDLAAAVKAADPGAGTLGPSEWGWPNYFCSAADDVDRGCFATSPDRAAHGGTELSAWYLQQFARYQQQTGTRLLDYFDLHYYEQGTYAPATDVTRSLWDPSFTDPSWIGQKIALLPRMRAWVQENYPGTKLALSEYNLGSGTDARTQTVVQADTLGLFGREGVGLATFWALPDSPVPTRAFELFRNYDGKGSAFGDRGVAATSSDELRLAVYAARVGKKGPLTVVVVNKAGTKQRSAVRVKGLKGARRVRAFQYRGGAIKQVRRASLRMSFPARSITVLEVRTVKRR